MLKTIIIKAIQDGANTRRALAMALSQGKRTQLSPYEIGLLAALVAEGAIIEEHRPYGASGARTVKHYSLSGGEKEEK
jgi:hypothetical protein